MTDSDPIRSLRHDDGEAANRIFPLIYDELQRIARAVMRSERTEHTLEPTALVNEAYLRLVRVKNIDWKSKTHFLALAAKQMRRVLVEHARAGSAAKRGGPATRITLVDGLVHHQPRVLDVLEIDDALSRLAELSERQAQVAELRFFAGLTEEEVGLALDISVRTVKRDWAVARAWLARELDRSSPAS